MVYALDTNIIIHYLRKQPNVCKNLHDAILRGDSLVVPKIVNYEIRRGFRIFYAPNNESAYNILTGSDGFCDIVEMDMYSWEKAEEVYEGLYKKRLTVGELDILIAAFCIENGYTLVTNNVKHFKDVNELTVEDWTIHN